MLVLTRKLNEEIYIGETIIIAVVGQHGKEFRVGIKAPDDVEILRREVHEAVIREAIRTGQTPPPRVRGHR